MFRSTASTAPEPVQVRRASGRLVHVVFGDRTGYRIPEVRIERRVEGFVVHDHGPDLARGADVGEGIAVDQNDVCKRVDQAGECRQAVSLDDGCAKFAESRTRNFTLEFHSLQPRLQL